MRHRPHRGRKGPDLALNRKGNLGGRPNPKKVRSNPKEEQPELIDSIQWIVLSAVLVWLILFVIFLLWYRAG